MKRFKKVLLGFSVPVLGVVVLLPYAHALPILEISSRGTTTVADGDGVGASKPALGGANQPSLAFKNSLQLSGTGSGTKPVKLTDTDFTLPLSSGSDSFLALIGGVTSGSVDSFTTYFNETNAAFGTGTQLASNNIGATNIDSQVIAIPEPGTLLLFGSGLIAIGAWRWKKSHS